MSKSLESGHHLPARILLVDDDEIFRSEFVSYFEQEYRIAEASSGEEALRILERPNEIDLVILDFRMSGMNGIEALERIKALRPKIRVIILTAYSSKDIVVESLRGKADDFMEKTDLLRFAPAMITKHIHTKEKEDFGEGIEGKIDRIKNYILKNADKKVTLEDAANLVCLSPKYLSRIFKKSAGVGFNEFALSLKVAHAREYLERTHLTVEAISERMGYMNSESLIRIFQKKCGVTPAEFRKRSRSDQAGKSKGARHGGSLSINRG